MKSMIRILIVGASITSCLELPVYPPSSRIIAVSGILQNRTDFQRIYLTRGSSDSLISGTDTLNIDGIYEELSVNDAEVTLSWSGNFITYTKTDSLPGEYFLESWTPIPGKTYYLKIHHPDFPDIRASTRVPEAGPFNLKYDFTTEGDLNLSWDKIPDSYGYLVWIYQWKDYYDENFQKFYRWSPDYYFLTQSPSNTVNKKFLLHRDKETDLKIICSAIDENYYNFLKLNNQKNPFDFNLFEYGNYSTVENGVGYLGSASVDSLIILR